jgi:hypothetical protein
MKCTCDTHKTCQIHNPLTDNMSDQPKSTGEWTVEQRESNGDHQRHFAVMDGHREIVRLYFTRHPVNDETCIRDKAYSIRDAHNAALAAERETARQIKTAWDELSIAHGQLQHALAAEMVTKDNLRVACEDAQNEAQQLREQLAALQGTIKAHNNLGWSPESGLIIHLYDTAALDAAIATAVDKERLNYDQVLRETVSKWEKYCEEQLAAAQKPLVECLEQLQCYTNVTGILLINEALKLAKVKGK